LPWYYSVGASALRLPKFNHAAYLHDETPPKGRIGSDLFDLSKFELNRG